MIESGRVAVNGVELYYEIRRSDGPALLMIPGGAWDGGMFDLIADRLAQEYTLICYDCRGLARSPKPAGWETMTSSVADHADDAAGLLEALGFAPALVFGTSGGAIVLLELLARHPEVVRGAVIHEPPVGEPGRHTLRAIGEMLVQEGVSAADLMKLVCGEVAAQAIPTVWNRMSNDVGEIAHRWFPVWMNYEVPEDALARTKVPIITAVGRETADNPVAAPMIEATTGIAKLTGSEMTQLPGGHQGFVEYPDEWVEALLPSLRKLDRSSRPQ